MKPLIILTGPTAVGKTALSLLLGGQIGGEIISADSMQVYRYMDIGTAKIRPEEMQGIPHHLIDILDPHEEFHVAAFQSLARNAIQEIYDRGHIPILTGGTGFYIQALLYDIDFTETNENRSPASADSCSYRQKLELLAEEKGAVFLHNLLRTADPESAAAIHPNNHKRIIRALEYHHLTGGKISQHNQTERAKDSPYTFCYFVLDDYRDRIYEQINRRVDRMIADGLEEEVCRLIQMGCTPEMTSMQGLGYKEMLACLTGRLNREEAIRLIKQNTRHFAKRQLTWFRRERDVIRINKADFSYDETAILRELNRYLVMREMIP